MFVCLVFVFFLASIHYSSAVPTYTGLTEGDTTTSSISYPRDIVPCEEEVPKFWSFDFHTCFIDRKYKDGGRNLESIVDRILDHAKDCVVKSSKNCRPDFNGFMVIMDKVVSQIKDYSEIYLEDIYKGREKIKDLVCVEDYLSTKKYSLILNVAYMDSFSENQFQRNVEEALSAIARSLGGCSRNAKKDLDKIVRTILIVDEPPQDSESEETSEEIRERPPPPPPTTTRRPPTTTRRPVVEETQWAWYDYIIQPIVSAWNAFRNFFGF